MDYKTLLTLLTPLTLIGSAIIAFVTVRVTQKFNGEAIAKAEGHIDRLFKEKDNLGNKLTKLETEVELIKNSYASKDEIIALQAMMKHIENDLSKLDVKMDRIMEIIIKNKD